MLLADSLAAVEPELRTETWRENLALPVEPLTGQPMRIRIADDGGLVLWSVAAEDPGMGSGRVEVVWQNETEALPPELGIFADDWAVD